MPRKPKPIVVSTAVRKLSKTVTPLTTVTVPVAIPALVQPIEPVEKMNTPPNVDTFAASLESNVPHEIDETTETVVNEEEEQNHHVDIEFFGSASSVPPVPSESVCFELPPASPTSYAPASVPNYMCMSLPQNPNPHDQFRQWMNDWVWKRN
jgi:hypothetical protein